MGALLLVLAGCGQSAPEYGPTDLAADDPAKAELTQKLEQMTPEQRAQYVQQNQAEVQRTFSGVYDTPSTGR